MRSMLLAAKSKSPNEGYYYGIGNFKDLCKIINSVGWMGYNRWDIGTHELKEFKNDHTLVMHYNLKDESDDDRVTIVGTPYAVLNDVMRNYIQYRFYKCDDVAKVQYKTLLSETIFTATHKYDDQWDFELKTQITDEGEEYKSWLYTEFMSAINHDAYKDAVNHFKDSSFIYPSDETDRTPGYMLYQNIITENKQNRN